MNLLNTEEIATDIAKRHKLVRKTRRAKRLDGVEFDVPADLSTQKSDADDFYEVAVWNVKAALEEAYLRGWEDGCEHRG